MSRIKVHSELGRAVLMPWALQRAGGLGVLGSAPEPRRSWKTRTAQLMLTLARAVRHRALAPLDDEALRRFARARGARQGWLLSLLALEALGLPVLGFAAYTLRGVTEFGLPVLFGGNQTGTIVAGAWVSTRQGYLLCDGSAVSRTTYARLFGVIGTTFGAGDGSSTFNVPDLRGRAVVALDNLGGSGANRIAATWADSLGGVGGHEKMQQHTHLQDAHGHSNAFWGGTHMGLNGGSVGYRWQWDFTAANNAGSFTVGSTTATNQNAGTGNAENIQPSIALGYIIKA